MHLFTRPYFTPGMRSPIHCSILPFFYLDCTYWSLHCTYFRTTMSSNSLLANVVCFTCTTLNKALSHLSYLDVDVGWDVGDEDDDDYNNGDNDYNHNDDVDFGYRWWCGLLSIEFDGQSKREAGPRLSQYKNRLSQVWDSHVKDETVVRSSYL